MLLAWGVCQSEDLKSAVVVGLPHTSLKSSLRLNFWLTVLTGISDPELVFGFHSSHVVMRVLIHLNSVDSTLADRRCWICKKKFPDKPCVSQVLGGPFLRLGSPRERLSIHSTRIWMR